ncbi:hypothetical protein LTR87_004782 [Friedmanniomyces endolithicus]|nr:hypothetical protein LTR87_004782 [Friedmanniomyces endolithicus]
MKKTTTGEEDGLPHQTLAQEVSGQQNATTTIYGASTIAPHLLMLHPDSDDAMSWTGASSSSEDAYMDSDGTHSTPDSSYPSEYLEANVRALMAESAPMWDAKVPGYEDGARGSSKRA